MLGSAAGGCHHPAGADISIRPVSGAEFTQPAAGK
jgi:hypothetical protein